MLKRIKRMAENSGWHIEKRLNVGDILTMLPMVAVMFLWGTKVETRIAVLEDKQIQSYQTRQEIKISMQRLNDKMDRILEREILNGKEKK